MQVLFLESLTYGKVNIKKELDSQRKMTTGLFVGGLHSCAF